MLSKVVPKIKSKHSEGHCVLSVTKSQFLVWDLLASWNVENYIIPTTPPNISDHSWLNFLIWHWHCLLLLLLLSTHNQAATCARNCTIKIHPAQSYAFYLTENSNFVIYLCKLHQQPFGLFANCILFENQNLYILTMLISDYNLLYVLGHHCLSPSYW